MRFCENCGNELQPKQKFCGKCGAPVRKRPVKSRKKSKKIIAGLACTLTAIIFVAIFGVFAVPAIKTYQTYQRAEKLLQEKKYKQAKKIYHQLGDYKNSENQKNACEYGIAEEYFKENDFEEAKKIYETLGDYKEAEQYLLDCKYEIANGYFADGSYQEAYELYADLEKAKYPGAKEKSQNALQEAAAEKYQEKIDELEIEMEEYSDVYEEEESYEEMYYDFCDITGDGIDELFLYSTIFDCDAMVEVYTYKDSKVSLIGTMEGTFGYYYPKGGNIIVATLGSCGCSNETLYQYQDGKLEEIARVFSDDYEDYDKTELPKGRFKKSDTIYRYTEIDEETKYYTEDEFESMIQKNYGIDWVSVGWDENNVQELKLSEFAINY